MLKASMHVLFGDASLSETPFMEKWLPSRYLGFAAVLIAFAAGLVNWPDGAAWRVLAVVAGALVLMGATDLAQKHSTLRRNYPLLAHIRYFFEYVRPMLRQYVVESDNEEVPFSNVQRAIVKQRAKNILDGGRSARSLTSTPSATSGSIIRSRRRASRATTFASRRRPRLRAGVFGERVPTSRR